MSNLPTPRSGEESKEAQGGVNYGLTVSEGSVHSMYTNNVYGTVHPLVYDNALEYILVVGLDNEKKFRGVESIIEFIEEINNGAAED